MENSKILINVQLTEKDVVNVSKKHRGKLGQIRIVIYLVVLIIAFGVVYLPYIIDNGFENIDFVGLLPLVVFVLVFLLAKFLVRQKITNSFKNEPFLNNPYSVTLNNDGLVIDSYRSNIKPIWKDIYRYNITNEAIYVYLADLKVIIIPTRFFINKDEIIQAGDLLKNNVDLTRFNKQFKWQRILTIIVSLLLLLFITYVIFSTFKQKNDLFSLGLEKENTDKHLEAFNLYSQYIYLNPTKANAHLQRAGCALRLGYYKFALQDCETALKLGSKDGYTFYVYACALYDNQYYNESCEAIKKAKQLDYKVATTDFCD